MRFVGILGVWRDIWVWNPKWDKWDSI